MLSQMTHFTRIGNPPSVNSDRNDVANRIIVVRTVFEDNVNRTTLKYRLTFVAKFENDIIDFRKWE